MARTPEQIAAEIVERYRFEKRHSPCTSICEMVAAAIRAERRARDAAVAAERERCAKVAEDFFIGDDIAAAIRKEPDDA